MSDERIQTLVGIPPKELDMLRRKAAAFDAMVDHGVTVAQKLGKWQAYDRYHLSFVSLHATPLEAVEAAVNVFEAT